MHRRFQVHRNAPLLQQPHCRPDPSSDAVATVRLPEVSSSSRRRRGDALSKIKKRQRRSTATVLRISP